MVPYGKIRSKALERFILDYVTTMTSVFEISDTKSDGTAFVRFRSSSVGSAIGYAETFRDALNGHELQFVQTDDAKFRIALDQFPETV